MTFTPISPVEPARTPRLEVQGVSHAYVRAAPVLRDINLSIEAGRVHCLLGPSGSGKSTLLRLIAGLERLQHGRVLIDAREVAGPDCFIPPERRSIGFVFQDYALFPHLNVRRNVMFGMTGPSRAERAAEADRLLAEVDLAAFATAMPHTLSGGQQQRVALARALARRPAVMLLDEPFSGLDADLREQLRLRTLNLLRASGAATLMVTHDPREAQAVADDISVIAACATCPGATNCCRWTSA